MLFVEQSQDECLGVFEMCYGAIEQEGSITYTPLTPQAAIRWRDRGSRP